MSKTYYSTFNPHDIDEETLERLFVAREDLAADVLEGIRESAATGNKHQRLLVGPRGIGKTHFVTLIYRRVRRDRELDDRLKIAWLNEDLRIHNYAGLLLEVLAKLGREYDDPSVPKSVEEVLDLSGSGLQEAVLEKKILELLGEKTLLLITENLDDLLTVLKEEGQRKLRALVETRRNVTILATSTSLVDSVVERKKTFFGFFRISALDPLKVEEATQLLALLAEEDGETELARDIRGPLGFARIRAIHYLAGGNPRVYVLLYDFLSRESLDDLTRPFMKLIDGLTPYYQSRMDRLAPLQRTVIDVLSRHREPLAVAKIARQAMSSPQSISSQLGQLRDLGYVVRAASLGRESFYELREPLMRFCLQVKEQQGRTIELFVQFLRVWYSEPELDRLATSSVGMEQEAARRAMLEQDPLLPTLAADFASHQSAGNHELALAIAESAITRSPGLKVNWVRKARSLKELERSADEQLAAWLRVIELDPKDVEALNLSSILLYELGRFGEATVTSRKAFDLSPRDATLARNLSHFLAKAGERSEASVYREKTVELSGEPSNAAEWDLRGVDLGDLQRMDEAWDAFRRSLEEDPRRVATWGHLWYRLEEECRYRLFHDMAEAVVGLLPEEARLHSYLGTARMNLGHFEAGYDSYERALELDPELDRKGEPTAYYRIVALSCLGKNREALAALEEYRPTTRQRRFRAELFHARLRLLLGDLEAGAGELDRLLDAYEPPFWTGRDLRGSLSAPLEASVSPAVWRSMIEVWLTSCQRHRCLDELGQGLVHSLKNLVNPRISDEAAREWLAAWEELAAGVEELELPLKLFRAGVEFRAGLDDRAAGRRALLGLAREERGLLSPWLGNLFAAEPDEVDLAMRELLRKVETRIPELVEEERSRAFWAAPVPELRPAGFARLLEAHGRTAQKRPNPLLPGSWQELGRAETEALLELAAEGDDLAARAWSRPGLEVLTAEEREIPFSPWRLYQIHLREEGRAGALDLLASEDRAVVLDGRSQTLFDLVGEGAIALASEEARHDYTRFFCNTVRGKEGRFQIVEALEEVPFQDPAALPGDLEIQPWTAMPDPAEANGSTEGGSAADETAEGSAAEDGAAEAGAAYSGTVLYSNALFAADFRLNSFSKGYVEMLDDDPIAQDLEIHLEHFDGPLRFLPRDQNATSGLTPGTGRPRG